jgi:hypothetical protein
MARIPGQISRRRRVHVSHEAKLVTAAGAEHSVTITDVSAGGFRLRSDVSMAIGEHVFLRVDRYGDFPAQIRWSLGPDAGGVFLEPVSLP